MYVDGFQATPPPPTIPEPGTLALIGTGLLGLFRSRLKKR
jgi:hypothetical protein